MLEQMSRNWWILAIRGLAGVLFGALAIIYPGPALAAIVMVFAAYALLDGFWSLSAAFGRRGGHVPWWAMLIQGLLGIGVAIALFLAPDLSVLVLLFVIAAWAIVTGALRIYAAIQLRRELEGEWLLALQGAALIFLGALTFALPRAGAVVMAWTLGGYALVSGGILLALAFRLRSLGADAQGRRRATA